MEIILEPHQMGIKTTLTHTDDKAETWEATVTMYVDDCEYIVTVMLNIDTIICRTEIDDMLLIKTYAWPKNVGRIESAATICAIKILQV